MSFISCSGSDFAEILDLMALHGQAQFPSLATSTIETNVFVAPRVFDEGIAFYGLKFLGPVTFHSPRFRGRVIFENCEFESDVSFSSAIFESELTFNSCTFHGELKLDEAEVRGKCLLAGTKIEKDASFVSSRLSSLTVAPQIKTSPGATQIDRACRIDGILQLRYAEIDGDVLVGTAMADSDEWCEIGGIEIRGTEISDFELHHARIKDGVDASLCRAKVFYVVGSTIGAGVTLSGAHLAFAFLSGTDVRGSVTMIGGSADQIRLEPRITGDERLVIRETTVGNLVLSGIHVTTHVTVDVARIEWDRPDPEESSGVFINNVQIGDRLTFSRGESVRKAVADAIAGRRLDDTTVALADPWQGGLEVVGGDVVIRRCQIRARLDLTGVRLVGKKGSSPGKIELAHTSAAAVMFASPLSAGTFMERNAFFAEASEARCQPPQWQAYCDLRMSGGIGACCSDLSLDGVLATLVDLTGVTVMGDKAGGGKVEARDLQARVLLLARSAVPSSSAQRQQFAQRASSEGRPHGGPTLKELITRHIPAGSPSPNGRFSPLCSASIYGSCDLSGSKIGELFVSGESFPHPDIGPTEACDQGPAACGIVFDDTEIDRLHLLRRTRGSTSTGDSRFPIPVSLRDMRVTTWELQDRYNPSIQESTQARDYLDFLDNDSGYHETIYTSVERYLRERGQEQEAREIYIAGRFRRARTRTSLWRPGLGRVRGGHPLLPELTLDGDEVRMDRKVVVALLVLGALFVVGPAQLREGLNRLGETAGILFGTDALDGFADSDWADVPLLVLVVLGVLVIWRNGPLWRMWNRLFWTFLEYGTRPLRLLGTILVLAALTFFGVAANPVNIDGSIGYREVHPEICPTVEPCHPGDGQWTWGQAFWITAEAHVPLVQLFRDADWRPAKSDVVVFGRWKWWMDAYDWFGAMSVINWILWPIYLPWQLRQLIRPQGTGS